MKFLLTHYDANNNCLASHQSSNIDINEIGFIIKFGNTFVTETGVYSYSDLKIFNNDNVKIELTINVKLSMNVLSEHDSLTVTFLQIPIETVRNINEKAKINEINRKFKYIGGTNG